MRVGMKDLSSESLKNLKSMLALSLRLLSKETDAKKVNFLKEDITRIRAEIEKRNK